MNKIHQLQHDIHELEHEVNGLNFKLRNMRKDLKHAIAEQDKNQMDRLGFTGRHEFNAYAYHVHHGLINWAGDFLRVTGINPAPFVSIAKSMDHSGYRSSESSKQYEYGTVVPNFIKGCFLLKFRTLWIGGFDGDAPMTDEEAYVAGVSIRNRAEVFNDSNPDMVYFKKHFGDLTAEQWEFIKEDDDHQAEAILKKWAHR